MDSQLEGAVNRFIGKEDGDLPDSAADNDDAEADPNDIEHEQIYYLLADAYPDKFDDPQDAKETIHEALGMEQEEKEEDPCWDGYEQQGMKEGDNGEKVPNCVPKNDGDEKGIDEEEATEEDDDFNPGNTPDNFAQHPHDEAGWQEDYNRDLQDKTCDHTDHRGRALDEEECPWCEGEDEA